MRKLSIKEKLHRQRRGFDELKKRRTRKNRRILEDRKRAAKQLFLRQNPTFYDVQAPGIFSLEIDHVNEFLGFIRDIKKYGEQGYFIRLHLEDVQRIEEGSIAMLLSVISDLERKGIFFHGLKPVNITARDVLERSGFFKHMKASVSKKNKISKNDILTTGDAKTSQEKLTPYIHEAMETVWGEKARCPALYSGLGEMMRNSIDHAFKKDKLVIWHLGLTHLDEEKIVKFSFVDNGDGIIKTYQESDRGVYQKFKEALRSNAIILKEAFQDGIQSSTGLPWRGKGLPSIFELYEDGIIKNLVVITNDVYLNFDKELFIPTKVKYSGTYYYWEITNKCTKSCYPLNKTIIR